MQGVTAILRKISRSWAPRLQNSRNWWAKKWGPTCDRDISNSAIYTTAIYRAYTVPDLTHGTSTHRCKIRAGSFPLCRRSQTLSWPIPLTVATSDCFRKDTAWMLQLSPRSGKNNGNNKITTASPRGYWVKIQLDFNSITPGRCGSNFKSVISEHMFQIEFKGTSHEIACVNTGSNMACCC